MPGGLSGVPSYTITDAGRVRPLCERPPKKDKKRSVNSCALICALPKRWTKDQREDLEKKTPGITVLRRLELGAFLVQIEEAFEDFLLAQVGRPAIGRGDRFIQFLVCVSEPIRRRPVRFARAIVGEQCVPVLDGVQRLQNGVA